jgi:glycerol-3-phosphate cytidylyltransferase-like family protein
MIDLTEQERAAIAAAVKPVAEIITEIGWQTRFCDLTEHQVLTLIEVAVGGFKDAMHATAKNDPMEVPF